MRVGAGVIIGTRALTRRALWATNRRPDFLSSTSRRAAAFASWGSSTIARFSASMPYSTVPLYVARLVSKSLPILSRRVTLSLDTKTIISGAGLAKTTQCDARSATQRNLVTTREIIWQASSSFSQIHRHGNCSDTSNYFYICWLRRGRIGRNGGAWRSMRVAGRTLPKGSKETKARDCG
jgi:hypothetical protein